MISNALHRLAHWIDRSSMPCVCEVRSYQKAWKAQREIQQRIREKAVPDNPEAEREFRERLWRNEGAA